MKKISLAILVAATSLGGCGGAEFADIDAKMKEARDNPKGEIAPPPEFEAYQTFLYSASAERSPFQPPMEVEAVKVITQKSSVKPNEDRPKEALEDFSFETLSMVGTLRRPTGSLYGLIKSPDGGLHRVRPGNYMGTNHGKITKVDSIRIDVIEIVSDGQGGWIERPRTIALAEQN